MESEAFVPTEPEIFFGTLIIVMSAGIWFVPPEVFGLGPVVTELRHYHPPGPEETE